MGKTDERTGNKPWDELKDFLQRHLQTTKELLRKAPKGDESHVRLQHEATTVETILKQMRVIEKD